MSNYYICQKLNNGHFRLYNNATNTFSTTIQKPTKINVFELFKGYEPTDEGVLLFNQDFKKWCHELANNKVLQIDYTKYFSHHSAVELTFKRLCKGRYEHHEQILCIEGRWSDLCNNGGLIYCNPGIHDSYGYDGKNFYASILGASDLQIPSKQGQEVMLAALPSLLKAGYYKVMIQSDDSSFKKIFAFSQNHVYTHVSLQYAIDHAKDFAVSISLIHNGKPNAYVYSNECMVSLSNIFDTWFDKLSKIKALYPKNKLIKHLLSSLWGSLCRSNHINKSYDQIIKEGISIGRDERADYIIKDHIVFDDQEYYQLIDKNNPYKFNLRLKSFITSYGRTITADVALLDIDSVVRQHTDCVVFNKPMKMVNKIYIAEDKTTGRFDWKNVNKNIRL